MNSWNFKKCPLCGHSLTKNNGKVHCEKCQIEIKGDTIQMNPQVPPGWEKD